MRDNRIVVTGLGAVSCLGADVQALWEGLVAGRCGIGPLTRLDAKQHRYALAGQAPELNLPPDEKALDLAVQYLLTACREAMRSAGCDGAGEAALFLASNFGAMGATERCFAADGEIPESLAAQALMDGPTHQVARRLGIRGLRSTLSLSCASGNAAFGYAAHCLRSGRQTMAMAGGYDAISEIVWAGLGSLRAMSSTAVRPFDRKRDGTIFSEGAGIMLLEPAWHALERGAQPLAELMGYGTSNNAYHMTHPDADGAGMVRAMRLALADAGIGPDEVDHVNCHATGTALNDKVETAAVKQVFGGRAGSIPLNGIKGAVGHAMGAASALEGIATTLTIRDGIIPPTVGLEEPDPECDLDYTPRAARKQDVRTAISNSAGFGGCNATVVFRKWEPRP